MPVGDFKNFCYFWGRRSGVVSVCLSLEWSPALRRVNFSYTLAALPSFNNFSLSS